MAAKLFLDLVLTPSDLVSLASGEGGAKMKRLLLVIMVLFLAGGSTGAALAATPGDQQEVVTAASKNLIKINLSYSGDDIYFFGVSPVKDCDLIIRLTTEKSEKVKLSVKGRVGPFWMTVKQYEVSHAPFIYKIHSTKPVDQIVSRESPRSWGWDMRRCGKI